MQERPTKRSGSRKADYRARRRTLRHPFLLAAVLCALLSAVGAVCLGIYLGGRVPAGVSDRQESETVQESLRPVSEGRLPAVRGRLLDLSQYEDEAALREAAEELAGEADAVSVCLRSRGGELYVHSAVAQAFGLQETGAVGWKVDRAVAILREAGLTVIGYLDLTGFAAGQDPYVQQARISCDAALVSELASAGFDELVLCGGTEALTFREDLSALAEAVREIWARGESEAETVLSLAITPGVLFSDDAAVAATAWLRQYDALVLDLRNYSGQVGEQVGMWTYWLLRYEMRLLLPVGEGAAAEERRHGSWLEAAV